MTFKYPKIKIIYDLLELLASNFIFFIIIFIVNAASDSGFISLLRYAFFLFVGFSFLSRLATIFFTRVEFGNDGIRVYTGIFSKSERFIPKDKLENIQTSNNVFQRLFRVSTIVIETGDSSGEVMLDFVNKTMLEKIQHYTLSSENPDFIEKSLTDSAILFTPTIKDLLKASLTSFSFLAIVPIAFNLFSDFFSEFFNDFDLFKLPISILILLTILGIIFAFGIGIVKTFNKYYRYQISMDDERIYVKKGWLSKQSFSIRKEKVQAVIYKQSGYQRLLRVTTVRLISTGEVMASEDNDEINEFFPYLPTAKANALVAAILPEFSRQPLEVRSTKKAKKLIWLKPPIFTFIVALLGFIDPILLSLAAVVLILTLINRILTYRNFGFTLKDQHVQVQSGIYTLETVVTKRPKLIEASFDQGPIQRYAGVMDLELTNRAHPVHTFYLMNIDAELRNELQFWFEQRAKEVKIDPKTMDGALKKETVIRLLNALNMKKTT